MNSIKYTLYKTSKLNKKHVKHEKKANQQDHKKRDKIWPLYGKALYFALQNLH